MCGLPKLTPANLINPPTNGTPSKIGGFLPGKVLETIRATKREIKVTTPRSAASWKGLRAPEEAAGTCSIVCG